MKLYDISPTVSPSLAVWPGDTPPRREVLLDIDRGDNLTLSTLHATVHLGAHADAPSHYGAGAPAIDRRPLDAYLGRCQVVRVDVRSGSRLGAAAVPGSPAARLLFATGSYPDPDEFRRDFAALSVELIDTAHRRGVRLIGIDTPSVDLFESKELPAHHACLARDVAILEGLVLDDVPVGVYELIALPLKLAGFDASPVRAVLRSID
ncbi:MAG TPA: cyclase family protein [Candidatus Polarisedimenticolaceae bacterium]|nr:cyclase family protein [Candidatus Polarisedimenticolaceae bacterium]